MQGPVTWQAVRDEALRRIRARDWPPGARIPHEAELALELGCARATVNRALRDLAGSGLLERKRKAGTRVPLTPVRKATFEISIIRHDVEARGQTHGYRLLSDTMAPPPPAVKSALSLTTAAPLRHVTALHLANGQPFALEDRWLNPAFVPATVRFATVSANEWLVRNLSFSAAGVGFHAVAADSTQARLLGCATGAALLALERTTFADAAPITAATLVYAPGYRMETSL